MDPFNLTILMLPCPSLQTPIYVAPAIRPRQTNGAPPYMDRKGSNASLVITPTHKPQRQIQSPSYAQPAIRNGEVPSPTVLMPMQVWNAVIAICSPARVPPIRLTDLYRRDIPSASDLTPASPATRIQSTLAMRLSS